MKSSWTVSLAVMVVVGGVACAVSAAEHPGQAVEQKAAPTSSTLTSTPKVASAEGPLAALDLASQAPSVKLTAADGKAWTLALDPKTVTVWKSGQLGKLQDLKVGDALKVRYTEKEGKKWAKSIEVVSAPTPVTASAPTPAAPAESKKAN